MTTLLRLRCNSVRYRQGFVEVSNVHHGCVNIESWDVSAEVEALPDWVSSETLTDKNIVGNCELELSADQARELAAFLLVAAKAAEEMPPTSEG
jgi:hypothetical protein